MDTSSITARVKLACATWEQAKRSQFQILDEILFIDDPELGSVALNTKSIFEELYRCGNDEDFETALT